MVDCPSKPTVLIVDDIIEACKMAREMFASFGYKCFEARNGHDALRILSEHPEIGLLFSDVRMPGMSGHELASKALAIRPGLAVLLTSGWTGETPIDDTPFVAKPYRMSQLQALVERLTTATRSTSRGWLS
jgi:CheY-like chemotaxis protein